MYYIETPLGFSDDVSFYLNKENRSKLTPTERSTYHTLQTFKEVLSRFENTNSELSTAYIQANDYKFINLPITVSTNNHQLLPDINTRIDGFHIVSDRLKVIIEKNDPNTHVFHKVKVITDKGDVINDYNIMQVGRIIYSQHYEKGIISIRARSIFEKKVLSNLPMNSDIHKYPLFIYMGLTNGFYVSDSLFNKLNDESIKGLWPKESLNTEKYGHPSYEYITGA